MALEADKKNYSIWPPASMSVSPSFPPAPILEPPPIVLSFFGEAYSYVQQAAHLSCNYIAVTKG